MTKQKRDWTVYNANGILCIAALGGLMLGLETTSIAVFLGSDLFMEYFDFPGPLLQGLIGASSPLAAFVGCWLAGAASDKFGRVSCLQIAAGIWCIGSLVSMFSLDVVWLIAGRATKGLSVGILSSMLTVYLLEVTPESKRGFTTSTMQWCLTWGIMLMFYLSFFCDFIDNDLSFRIAWAVEGSPGFWLLACSFFLPESPKWLASKSKWQLALNIMEKLDPERLARSASVHEVELQDMGPAPTGSEPTLSTGNLNSIETVLGEYESDPKSCTYLDLLRSGLRLHLLTGVFTQSVVQLSGIGVLMYYLVFICEMIGLTGQTKIISASIQYVINVVFTVLPIMFIGKMRRKDILVYGAACLGVCITAVGVTMGIYGHEVEPIGGNESVVWEVTGTPGSFCLALCFLFVAIFASTLSCAAWLYTNEIFPVRAKAKGSAICMSVSWSLSFILTFLAPISLASIKWGTFILFGACGLLGAIVMGLWFPETYGLSEADIDAAFGIVREGDLEANEKTNVDQEKIENEATSRKSKRRTTKKPTTDKDAAEGPPVTATEITNNGSGILYNGTGQCTPIVLENISRLSTMRLSIDGHMRLSPPKQPKVSAEQILNQVTGTQTSPTKGFTGQESPFLKKNIGAPFEAEMEESQPPTTACRGTAPASALEAIDDSEKSDLGTPGGYYNLLSSGSPFLNGYL